MKYIKIEDGKAVLKKKERIIKTETVYNNIFLVDSPIPVKIPKREKFLYGICPNCSIRYFDIEQKYCESCGVEL